MKKKLISLLLVTSMTAALVAGCGGKSEEKNSSSTGEGTETASSTEASDGEMADIKVSWMTLGPTTPAQTDAVVEAINKITEKKINTHVEINFYDPNTYATQIPMMLQANEKLDLMMYTPVPGAGYESFKSQNQLQDISGLLDKYGKDVKSSLGTLLDGTTTADGIFGAASNRNMASSLYVVMRKDTLDQLGLTDKAQNMTTWAEYEDICKQVKEKTDLAPVVNADGMGSVLAVNPYFMGGEKFADNKMFDNIGDTYNIISTNADTGKVECYYLTDDYKASAQRASNWYKEGLIYKDAATSQDNGDILIKNNVGFSTIEAGELGVAATKAAQTGHDMIATKITDAMLTTQSTYKFGFAVPVSATEPEAAVKFLNLLYSDADIENILAWGVEGRDWKDNGKGEATYPDGVTADKVTYHMADFLNGNQFITMPWEGSGADFRKTQQDEQKKIEISKYMGFSFDPAGVENELTACNNVRQQYAPGLSSGSTNDFNATYTEFSDKLKAAGIEKVVAAYQKQLDDWLAKKK